MVTDTKNDFVTKRVFVSFLLTIMLCKLSTGICDAVDTIIVGNFYDASYLSAIGFARPVIFFRSAIGYTISAGAVYMCALYISQNQREKVKQVFSIMALCALVLGSLFSVALLGFPHQIASLLGATGEIGIYTADYLKGIGLGMIPYLLNSMMIVIVPLNGSKDLSLKAAILLGGSNLIMDVAFALWTPLGLFGIALASSISYILALCITSLHFRRAANIFKFVPCLSAIPTLFHALKRGLPQGVYRISITLNCIFINAILFSVGGEVGMAVVAVTNSIYDILVGALIMGTSGVMNTMFALFYSEEDSQAMEETLKHTLKAQLLLSGALTLLLIVFAQPISTLYGIGSGSMAPTYVLVLCVYALSLMPRAILNVFTTAYNAVEREGLSILMDALQLVIFVPAIAFGLSKAWGVSGVFAGYALGSFAVLLLLVPYVYLKKRKIWPLEPWLLLPEGFGGPKKNILVFSVNEDPGAYIAAVDSIQSFCQRHGVSKRAEMGLFLCIEELSVIFLQHGKIKKNHSLDVRIVIKKNELILRIRDSSVKLNPFDLISKDNSVEDVDAMRMRMVQAMADEFEYYYSVDMNNVYIKLSGPAIYGEKEPV